MSREAPIETELLHTVERKASWVLRLGVWSSAALMTAGLCVAAFRSFQVTIPSPSPSILDVLHRLGSAVFDPVTLLYAGLLMLMITPILRVLAALVGFSFARDRTFVLVSLVVFLMLMGELYYSIRLE